MKATELRIGNIAYEEKGQIAHITGIDDSLRVSTDEGYFPYTPIEKITPVPLTEEWLLKLGFNKENSNHRVGFYKPILQYKRYLCWAWNTDDIGIENDEGDEIVPYIPCKYVHQLQNLYFALTGEELELTT